MLTSKNKFRVPNAFASITLLAQCISCGPDEVSAGGLSNPNHLTNATTDAYVYSIPAEVVVAGYNFVAFAEDFRSRAVIDYDNDGIVGSRWSNNLWWSPAQPRMLIDVSDGVAHLTTGSKDLPSNLTTLSHDTGSGRLFTRGYFETRMRWSGASNANPAFWLFSSEYARRTNKVDYCELDVFEHFYDNTFTGTAHYWHNGTVNSQNSNNNYRFSERVDWTQWHTYGMLWDKRITWFFDSKPLMSTDVPEICDKQSLFIIISSQLLSPGLPEVANFDWVRVIQKPGANVDTPQP